MNRLRELREDKDLYQKDIAKILNMSQTGYSQYETEIPSLTLLEKRNFINADKIWLFL